MKTPILVIFIDALPFDRGINIVNSLEPSTYSKSVPGVGYSINVKAEMFAGLKPDDVGYFCEWNYDPESKPHWFYSGLIPFMEFFSSMSDFANRVFHKLISKALRENIYAIPYRMLPLLKCSGVTAYEPNFDEPTFLSDGTFDRVLYSEEGVNDEKIFKKAIERLVTEKNERLFVSTAELDGVMHSHGMSCERYEDQIALIEKYVVKLVEKFMEINGDDARYFIFSDHGMAPVLEGVSVDIEESIGRPGHDSYVYFVDATFHRTWINDESLAPALYEFYNNIGGGHILSESERESYGLTDKKHGDIIFMLDESKQFAPNFFGKKTCKAMHGYDPDLESQQGIFISNIDGTHGEKIGAIDIFNTVKALV